MKTIPQTLALTALLATLPAAQAKLNVVATTPDLASIAQEIGGDSVKVIALAKPTEDPHFVDPKPSFVIKLNRADALIEGGAELESGWLGPLIQAARNSKLAPGAPGRIIPAQGVTMLDVPTTLDRARGDIHASGNPHYLTDPANAIIVARHINAALCKLDPDNCPRFESNLEDFIRRLNAKLEEWRDLLAPFRDQRIVAFHNTWPYFGRQFGLRCDLFLEPKPGIPPTPSHLASVIRTMQDEGIRAVLVEPYQDRRTAEKVARDASAMVVEVTQYPGGVKGTDAGYIEMMDHNVHALARALEQKKSQ